MGLRLGQDGIEESTKGEGEESPFYLLERVVLVVLFCDFGGMDVTGIFPYIVTFQVSLPLDEILEAF